MATGASLKPVPAIMATLQYENRSLLANITFSFKTYGGIEITHKVQQNPKAGHKGYLGLTQWVRKKILYQV